MNLILPDACTALAAGTFLLVTSVFCARAAGQTPADPAVQALLDRIEAARGKPAQSLAVDGTYEVIFAGAGTEPVAKGAFRARYVGADFARDTSEMGPLGVMENGVHKDVVWAVDPSMGATVHRGVNAAASRRFAAITRGASPRTLYASFESGGKKSVDGREYDVLRMVPAEGKADVWYVGADGLVARIDTWLPAPESADAAFGMSDLMESHVSFSDWKQVGEGRHPFRRTLQMGPATVTTVCTKVDPQAKIDPATFTPPESVQKVKLQPVEPAFKADGTPNYQIADRPVQLVASIRVKCTHAEIGEMMGVLLPEVMAHLNAVGAKVAGAPFSRYHGFADGEVDLEAGIPVQAKVAEKGRVKNSELPAGKVVTAWHIGPYDKLTAAHEGLQKHLADNKLKARGGVWEIYWTDPGMVPDQAKWRTQLFAPIE